MARNLLSVGFIATAAMMVVGCGSGPEGRPSAPAAESAPAETGSPATPAEWPKSDDPVLAKGREIWLENCENCHGIGKAESPRFADHEAWAPRVAKGEATLIASAINGFEGKSEAGMPPRGGNKDLSDEEVTAAARYMIRFSTKPRTQTKKGNAE